MVLIAKSAGLAQRLEQRLSKAETVVRLHLPRSKHYWELHGREILARVWAERPELYFKALVKLTLALHRATGEPTDFNRRRNREEVLRRLEARIADARTLPEQLKAGHEPGRSTKTDVPPSYRE